MTGLQANLSSRRARKHIAPFDELVIAAAREYVREVTNPAPDLTYRAHLRGLLIKAVDNLEVEMRRV